LKKYFNDESKLDNNFAKIAGIFLDKDVIYRDKHITCTIAMKFIKKEESYTKYYIFSNDE
jgi:hypothetical protein